VLSLLIVLGLVSWLGHVIARPSTFPVRHVQLTGELERLDGERLREVILPHVMHGLLRVDVNGLSSAVAALPWVRNATVRRLWPDVVEVEIREQKPLARWGKRGLINDEGQVFVPPERQWPAGLPLLEGPENTVQTMTSRYRELREVLAPLGLKVATLHMSERRALTLEMENGMRLLLGRSDQQPRLERFMRAFPQAIEPRFGDIKQVDLRYTNGFSVIWKQQGPRA
jgi:cell division protein FtsQ